VQEKKTAIGASSHATRARAADGFNVYAKECSIDAAAAAADDDGLKVQGKNTP
jgi:hypothetical protein